MAAIKRFFEKRKLDIKFKRAGDGFKLTDNAKPATPPVDASKLFSKSTKPSETTHEQRMAAEAALARFNQPRDGINFSHD